METQNTYNPFDKNALRPQFTITSLGGVKMLLEEEKELNYEPSIKIKGKEVLYQRGHVWNLQDKQNFIKSIYDGIDCGLILLKRNHFDIGNAPGGKFHDVIDGKQRLTALKQFYNNEFKDANGYYYKDFTKVAQRKFNHCFPFKIAFLDEDTSDFDVITQFLKTNFAGIPQTKEHLEFLNEMLKRIS